MGRFKVNGVRILCGKPSVRGSSQTFYPSAEANFGVYILQGSPLLPFTLRETRDVPQAYLSDNHFDGDVDPRADVA